MPNSLHATFSFRIPLKKASLPTYTLAGHERSGGQRASDPRRGASSGGGGGEGGGSRGGTRFHQAGGGQAQAHPAHGKCRRCEKSLEK